MITAAQAPPSLGWFGIIRMGLVQAALGAIVVLTTSTLNRVMVVELALPAMLPGALVGLHYALQVLRPRWGYGSDRSPRRTPWIIGGIAVLAAGGALAALATALMTLHVDAGVALAVLAFLLIGAGVGAAGTSLLTLLAQRVDERRRAVAATIVWIMMIAGFVITTIVAGSFLDPFTPARLVAVASTVSAVALAVTLLAMRGLEGPGRTPAEVAAQAQEAQAEEAQTDFFATLRQVWQEAPARRFTIFIFVSMLAYSAQDLILEPFAGAVFGMTPGQSTKLGGMQHAGALVGMILVGIAGTLSRRERVEAVRSWMVAGCLFSATLLVLLAAAGLAGTLPDGTPQWPLTALVLALGVGNGAFAIAAVGSMMAMASDGKGGRDGTRMGLWGAAQAVAFGIGGFAGTMAADLARALLTSQAVAYGMVFVAEAGLFVAAAVLALRLRRSARPRDISLHHGGFAGREPAAVSRS